MEQQQLVNPVRFIPKEDARKLQEEMETKKYVLLIRYVDEDGNVTKDWYAKTGVADTYNYVKQLIEAGGSALDLLGSMVLVYGRKVGKDINLAFFMRKTKERWFPADDFNIEDYITGDYMEPEYNVIEEE